MAVKAARFDQLFPVDTAGENRVKLAPCGETWCLFYYR